MARFIKKCSFWSKNAGANGHEKKLKNEFKTRVPNGSKIRKKSEYKPGAKWSKNSKKQ
jgi:hypothetical protein